MDSILSVQSNGTAILLALCLCIFETLHESEPELLPVLGSSCANMSSHVVHK